MSNEKQIRIIGSGYKDLFKINDGDSLKLIDYNNIERIEVCKYIDEYHFYFGNSLFHIHQFAENVKNFGIKAIPLRASLPDMCYALSDTDIVEVRKGVEGYYSTSMSLETPEDAKAEVRRLNEEINVTKPQAMAMVAGSMFGWDKDGADPKNYDENGVLKTQNQTRDENYRSER